MGRAGGGCLPSPGFPCGLGSSIPSPSLAVGIPAQQVSGGGCGDRFPQVPLPPGGLETQQYEPGWPGPFPMISITFTPHLMQHHPASCQARDSCLCVRGTPVLLDGVTRGGHCRILLPPLETSPGNGHTYWVPGSSLQVPARREEREDESRLRMPGLGSVQFGRHEGDPRRDPPHPQT